MLVLVCLVALPLSLSSQCNTTNITGGTYTNTTTGSLPYYYVTKTISNANTCTLTMFMSILLCDPGGEPVATGATGMTGMLTASAYTTATNPSCGWICDCGAVVIDGSSGLPVELMDFAVEDE